MHKRASSLRRTKEAEKEVRMDEKEVTSVEDVEMVARKEDRGDPNLIKLMELLNSMNEKLDKNKEETNDNFKKQKEEITENSKKQHEILSQNLLKQIKEQNKQTKEDLKSIKKDNRHTNERN